MSNNAFTTKGPAEAADVHEFSAALRCIVEGEPGRGIDWWAQRVKVSRTTLYNWMQGRSSPQAAKLYQLAVIARNEVRSPELLERLYAAPWSAGTVGEYLVPAALAELQTELLSLHPAEGLRVMESVKAAIAEAKEAGSTWKLAPAKGGLKTSSKQYLAELLKCDFREVEADIDRFCALTQELIRDRSTGEYAHGVLVSELGRRILDWEPRYQRTEFLDGAVALVGLDTPYITIQIRGETVGAEPRSSLWDWMRHLSSKLHIVNYCYVGHGG